jgi:hypothetical protein
LFSLTRTKGFFAFSIVYIVDEGVVATSILFPRKNLFQELC